MNDFMPTSLIIQINGQIPLKTQSKRTQKDK